MFLGHVAIAMVAKRAAPRVSLGWLAGAAALADLIWPVLLLLGWEHTEVVPGTTAFTPLLFTNYPVSHSLLASFGWGALAGGLFWTWSRDRMGALLIALLVPSHWVLDVVTHVPDLPLWPGGPRVGLGLWNSVLGSVIVELGVFAGGLWSYVSLTDPRDGVGKWGLATFAVFLTVVFFANAFGPPPPGARAVALVGLAGWLLPIWCAWFDAHRQVHVHGPVL